MVAAPSARVVAPPGVPDHTGETGIPLGSAQGGPSAVGEGVRPAVLVRKHRGNGQLGAELRRDGRELKPVERVSHQRPLALGIWLDVFVVDPRPVRALGSPARTPLGWTQTGSASSDNDRALYRPRPQTGVPMGP